MKYSKTRERQPYNLYLFLALFLFITQSLFAVKYCPFCNFRTSAQAVECPKCLRLIKWPMHPPREHRAKIVVRTGKDAFIRSPQAQNRHYPADRNAGNDISGFIGSWGGPTALRYLVRFDIKEAFLAAGVDIDNFQVRRARLKLTATIENVGQSASIPVVAYALEREFAQGTGNKRHRPKQIDGCTWFHNAPYMVWHKEGGDFSTQTASRGKLATTGVSFIDVTDIISRLVLAYQQSNEWQNPGLIIMGDPLIIRNSEVVNIYSLAARARQGKVPSPELLIE